jgi:ribosomal protein L15
MPAMRKQLRRGQPSARGFQSRRGHAGRKLRADPSPRRVCFAGK